MKQIKLNLDDEKHRAIKIAADREYLSMTAYCQRALDRALEVSNAAPVYMVKASEPAPVAHAVPTAPVAKPWLNAAPVAPPIAYIPMDDE